MTVLQFKQKEEQKEHKYIGGDAFCFQCKREWIAVAPLGTTQFECPSCGTLKGLLKFPFHVSEGELYRECDCGNSLFYITKTGHLCPNCGSYQTYDE